MIGLEICNHTALPLIDTVNQPALSHIGLYNFREQLICNHTALPLIDCVNQHTLCRIGLYNFK